MHKNLLMNKIQYNTCIRFSAGQNIIINIDVEQDYTSCLQFIIFPIKYWTLVSCALRPKVNVVM